MDENFVREREKAVQAVKECGEEALLGGRLWHAVSLYEGTTFYTSKKLPFTYRIKGRELFCDRKEKSITEATVLRAYKKILEARAAGEGGRNAGGCRRCENDRSGRCKDCVRTMKGAEDAYNQQG